jgi:hypothetical protein
MGIIRMGITDRIRTTATIMGLQTTGTAGIATTATIVIITTIGTKLTSKLKIHLSWLGSDSEPVLFFPGNAW